MRTVSLCFDDGLKQSADIAVELLDVPLNFFIVTGWLKELSLPICDSYNLGYDHGDIEYWRQVARKHLVGGHGLTHKKLTPENALDELMPCKQLIEEITTPPYTVAYPYLKTSPGSYGVFDWQRPFAHFPRFAEHGLEECVQQVLQALGEDIGYKWLPAVLHGVDGQGWASVDSATLMSFVKRLEFEGIVFTLVTEIMKRMEGKDDKCVIEFRKEVELDVVTPAEECS